MSVIGKGIAAYQTVQMDIIGKLSVGSEHVIDEIPFYDEGYISTQIERLKTEHEDVARDLKIATELASKSDDAVEKKAKLKAKMEKIEVRILYYAMNSFASLDLCKLLLKGKNIQAVGVIKALEHYQNGDISEAKEEFKKYFEAKGIAAGFFLPNKTYGEILLKDDGAQVALPHLEYAIQLKVDDRELLMMLADAYERTGKWMEKSLVNEVCQILGIGG